LSFGHPLTAALGGFVIWLVSLVGMHVRQPHA